MRYWIAGVLRSSQHLVVDAPSSILSLVRLNLTQIFARSLPLTIQAIFFAFCFGAIVFARDPLPPKELPAALFREDNFTDNFTPYCGHVWVLKGTNLKLEDMERRMICGDAGSDTIGKPWAEIPPNQARFFIRTFLQVRGHHDPIFLIQDNKLYVQPGPVTRLTEFEILNPPPFWRPPRKRGIKGLGLTPSLLDELETWTKNEVMDVGYACAEIKSAADPETGLARVDVRAGDRKRILDVLDRSETGLAVGVLDRYNAFDIGDYYSERLVRLSRQRLLNAGLLQAVSVSRKCYANGVIIERDAVMGPPREARFGFGGNTDEGARVRAVARLLRIGERASTAEARIDASFRRQRARAGFRSYYSLSQPRNFLEPEIVYERRDELKFESRALQATVSHGWNREFDTGMGELRLGPGWEVTGVRRGEGPRETTYTFFETQLQWQSHLTEYFESSPRSGHRFQADAIQTYRNWGAPFTSTRLQLGGLWLLNAFRFDPPLFIFGVRFRVGSTLTQRDLQAEQLPMRFRFFAGGTDDLRGFNPQALPFGGRGALSEATVGLEVRLYKVLWKRFDPLIFSDIGKLGARSLRLDEETYLSPGFGLRWESPVGTFRGFLARAVVLNDQPGLVNPAERWRAGLSYAEEF